MAVVLEGLGVDAVGVNCSLGPKELLPIIKRIVEATNIPVMAQPNAGLPELIIRMKQYLILLQKNLHTGWKSLLKKGLVL